MKINDIKQGQPVYVRNKTKSDFNLVVKPERDNPILVLIPRSSIPQDVTELVSSELLKESLDFRKALQLGVLELVSIASAEKELDTSEAKIEYALLKKKQSSIPTYLMSGTKDEPVDELKPIDAVAGAFESEAIRDEIRDIAVDVDTSIADKHARLISLNKERTLNKEESDFLLSSLPENFELNEWIKGIRHRAIAAKG
jgi:hypothetical protein